MISVQVLTIIVSVFIMLFVQGAIWFYKFGKLEEKVSNQNARIDDLEDFQKEQIDRELMKGEAP
jgi:hypothetical protein